MESVDDWIEKKLEEGADREALRQVIEEKGYDPGKVDEIAERGESQDDMVEKQPGLEQVSGEPESSVSDQSRFSGWKWDVAVVFLFLISVVAGILVSGVLPI